MAAEAITFPGQILGPVSEYRPGPGTYIQGSKICASCAGRTTVTLSSTKSPNITSPSVSSKNLAAANVNSRTLPTLAVTRNLLSTKAAVARASLVPTQAVLPTVDSTVLARVTRINPRQATVDILVIGEKVCVEGWQGLIRAQDIRATEKDKVKVVESFRPGDVVRAVVISLGDQSNYYLSTASNLLGVIMATSDAGNAMYPVSWKEFRDPVTGRIENRKVAKPF